MDNVGLHGTISAQNLTIHHEILGKYWLDSDFVGDTLTRR